MKKIRPIKNKPEFCALAVFLGICFLILVIDVLIPEGWTWAYIVMIVLTFGAIFLIKPLSKFFRKRFTIKYNEAVAENEYLKFGFDRVTGKTTFTANTITFNSVGLITSMGINDVTFNKNGIEIESINALYMYDYLPLRFERYSYEGNIEFFVKFERAIDREVEPFNEGVLEVFKIVLDGDLINAIDKYGIKFRSGQEEYDDLIKNKQSSVFKMING